MESVYYKTCFHVVKEISGDVWLLTIECEMGVRPDECICVGAMLFH